MTRAHDKVTRKYVSQTLSAVTAERDQLREVNSRLRDKLLELAKACPACEGTGVLSVDDELEAAFGKQLPCDECLDIREVLQ